MPIDECCNCGGQYQWSWTEAFDKFGFNDGDGQIETWSVEAVLTEAGYSVTVTEWGMHNTVISSIKKDDQELIPGDATVGYDEPRDYLPDFIIELLDENLPFDDL